MANSSDEDSSNSDKTSSEDEDDDNEDESSDNSDEDESDSSVSKRKSKKSSVLSSDDDDDDDSDDDEDSDEDDDDDDDDDSDNDSDSTSSSKNLTSDDGDTTNSTNSKNTNANNGPFHLNVDFDQVKERRERAKLAKKKFNDDDENDKMNFIKNSINNANNKSNNNNKTLLENSSLNQNNTFKSNKNNNKLSTNNSNTIITKTKKDYTKTYDKNLKPNIVIGRPKDGKGINNNNKDTNNNNNNNIDNKTKTTTATTSTSSFFNKLKDSINSVNNNTNTNNNTNNALQDNMIYEDAIIDLKPILVGKRNIAIWPYDDYHVIQKEFYQKICDYGDDETKEYYLLNRQFNNNNNNNNQNKNNNNNTKNKNNKRRKNKNNKDTNTTQQTIILNDNERLIQYQQYYQQYQQQYNSIPIFSRPLDPPDIATQVYKLNLSLFEETAIERSISIVSTWLFDVGLIDELLTTGGVPTKVTRVTTSTNNNNNKNSLINNNNKKSINNNVNNPKKLHDKHSLLNDDSEHSNKSNDILNIDNGLEELPIEEEITKMDKEIAKLRNSTKRALALINSRLNDGVIATGSEVEELVNAVVATKDDISKLRDLSSYVYKGNDGTNEQSSSQFLLTRYPKLKHAINARRNLARVFRELDFFSQIPITCDRLREELHSGEWTINEWSSLRSVAREHVDLEIFLVEAELCMKKRMEEDEAEIQAQILLKDKKQKNNNNIPNTTGQFSRNNNNKNAIQNNTNYALIDRFLEEHVQNVWDMGEEISIRIMNGIGTAFELAMTNPAGMVALVEAVEVYESANSDYKAVHGEEAGKRNTKLQFTDMRAAALAELYKDFEVRCLEVFNDLIAQASDPTNGTETPNASKEEDGDIASNKIFGAILRAANELGSEIIIVKERMAPCFPPNWAVTTLWTTCVAHVCSTNILQQIGGTDGQNLPDLSLKQLLDLVAWVENFRQTINEIFPNLSKITASKRNYLDKPPQLLVENSKTIDIALAEDSLVWINNTLWNIHNIAKDEFLFKTKETAELWLERGYSAEREVSQASDGKYRTAFCEDVYAMTSIHLRTIRERLTRQSEALVQAVGVIFKILFDKQNKCRESFCSDFHSCCAAANDFLRMSDKCEEMVDEIKNECNLSSKSTEILDEQSAALLGLYSSDAVYASKKTQTYCMRVIEEEIISDIFSTEWEEDLTDNEIASGIVRLLDECLEDLETYLDELMINKAAEAQISVAVNVYIKCLLQKASAHNNNKKSMFNDNELAIQRMKDDTQILRSYFEELSETMPTITKLIDDEFASLDILIELLSIAAGVSQNDLKESIFALQKRSNNSMITKLVIGDLWHAINPTEERKVYEIIEAMEETLNSLVPNDNKAGVVQAPDRNAVPGLRIDQMLSKYVEDDTRKRPMKAEAMKKAEGALRSWGLLRKKDEVTATVPIESTATVDDEDNEDNDSQ